MIRNRDIATQAWRQKYFEAYIRERIKDEAIWGTTDEAIEDFVFKPNDPLRHRIETELSNELIVLWGEITKINHNVLQQRCRIALTNDQSGLVVLEPPEGKLPTPFRQIVRIEDTDIDNGEDPKLQFVANAMLWVYKGARWAMEGRSAWILFGYDRTVGQDKTVEVVYVPEPIPPDLDAQLPYRVLPPQAHPVMAMGAALRILSPEQPEYRSLEKDYTRDKAVLLHSMASLQPAGREGRDDAYDFSIGD